MAIMNMTKAEDYGEVVETFVTSIAEKPDQVKVTSEDVGSVTIEVRIEADKETDIGKVIGHKGSNIQALRRLLKTSGKVHGHNVMVHVVD